MEGCSELGPRGASHATSTREFDQPSSESICCRLLVLARSCLPQVDEAQKGILEQRRSRLQMFASGSMVSIVDDREGSSGTPKALVRAIAEADGNRTRLPALAETPVLKTGGPWLIEAVARSHGNHSIAFGPCCSGIWGPKCKRIANVPRVTSRQVLSPDDIWALPKVHVTALFDLRRHPASGGLGSS